MVGENVIWTLLFLIKIHRKVLMVFCVKLSHNTESRDSQVQLWEDRKCSGCLLAHLLPVYSELNTSASMVDTS